MALKVLADETRLRILNLVMKRECCVCEVMRVLNISQTRASRNLSMLHEAGFLSMRKESLWVYYSINPALSSKYLADLTTTINDVMAKDKVALKDLNILDNSIPVACCLKGKCKK
jgi:ArsR family transcriptional regulator